MLAKYATRTISTLAALALFVLLGCTLPLSSAVAAPPAVGIAPQISGTRLPNEPLVYTDVDAYPVIRVGLGVSAHLTTQLAGRWGLRISGGATHFLVSGQRFTIENDNYYGQDGEARVRTYYNSYQTGLLLLYSLDVRHYFLIGPSIQHHEYRTEEEGQFPTEYQNVFDEYSANRSWSELRGGVSFGVGRRMTQRTVLEALVHVDDYRSEVVVSFSVLAPLRFLQPGHNRPSKKDSDK